MRSNKDIAVSGLTLHAELSEPAHPAGTLVLLHGFTGSAAGWGEHLDAFARGALRVIALDLPGHGQSDAPTDPRRYTMEWCANDIKAALRVLDVSEGEAVLLGYSMGGRVALYMALQGEHGMQSGRNLLRPYIRGLILESASPGLATEEEREQRRVRDEALADRIEREGVAAFVEYWERLPLFASQQVLPLEVCERQRRQRLANSPVGLANSLRGIGTGAQPALHSRLPELDLPVLLIAGELDAKFRAIAQDMAGAMPRARLAIVPNAGHAVHLEQPDIFDTLVLDFFRTFLLSP